MLSNQETMKFITPHPAKNVTEICEEIRDSLSKYHQKKEIPWIIIDKETNRFIGMFRFHKLNLWHKKAEMGVVISKENQGRGVMTEILPVLLQYGFSEMHLNRIVGDIFSGNKGSKKLLEKNGFRKEGTLRQTDFDGEKYHDTIVYSLLKHEFHTLHQLD